jgi:hypothetical protein
MNLAEGLKSAGYLLIGLAILAASIALGGSALFGATWLSMTVEPWLEPTFMWTLAICVLILLPTALFRATRGFSATSLFVASFIFGFIWWIWCFIVTMALWGVIGVVVGLLLAGIGIAPVAFLALLFHGEWRSMGDFVLMLVVTFGSRGLSAWLLTKI